MSHDLLLVLALLGAAIAMFAINRPRMDAVGLIMLTVLPFTGVLTIGEALAGFSDANIVLIAALFVIGDGLVRTGVARQLGDWLIAKAGTNEVRLIAMLMIVVCMLGATMSSTAVTAIFIPVALRIAQSTRSSPGRLMMPLSVAALISGMTTLIATAPNLVVNSELVRHLKEQGQTEGAGFHFFSFTPFGVPILILGIGYMLFARRWLPSVTSEPESAAPRPTLANWIDDYQLADREHRVRISSASPLVGKTMKNLRLRDASGANLIAIERDRKLIQPTVQTELRAGDNLLIDLFVPEADAQTLRQRYALEALPLSGSYFSDRSQEIGMAEVMLTPDSDMIGKTAVEARLRDRTGLTLIGIKHDRVAVAHGVMGQPMRLGDTLLVVGPWRTIEQLRPEDGLTPIRLPIESKEVLPVPGKAVHAVVCLLLVVALMISGVVPNVQAALIGCLLMGALGVVDLPSAYRSIDWKTIVLIVGMLPFSLALQRTGGVDLMADGLMSVIGGAGAHVVLACLFAITALLGLFISNTATAVLMAPVAIAVSEEMHASPYPFAMIVALAASTAFMTPISSPVNTLVVTPGNYSFGDFVRIGTPFSLIVMIVAVIMVPLLLPL